MVDAFLVISVIVVAALLLVVSTVIMIYFSHPDDRNQAKFPKAIVVFGLWLAFASVLVLPYDVANSRGSGGGLRVDILWYIVYITLAVLLVILIPFAIWYYENDNITDIDDERTGRCEGPFWDALKYTTLGFVIFIIILMIMWTQLGKANIPTTRLAQHVQLVVPIQSNAVYDTSVCRPFAGCFPDTYNWVIPVTFPIYLMATLSFIGWFFFSSFTGVGMMALPLDLIFGFTRRPKPMSTKVFFEERRVLGERAAKLIRVGEKIQELLVKGESRSGRQKRDDARSVRTLEKHYYLLKKDLDILNIAHKLKGGNPLWYIMLLFNGICSIILSITWIVHIIIFILPTRPLYTFLNRFFIILEEAFGKDEFPLLGIIAFAIYSFYLMACAVKGNFKLGIRFLFWKIYPMEINNTLMNAFLINTWFILLISVPLVQFSAFAFPIYVRYTSIDMLFGVQTKYLDFYRYFWVNDLFIYWMVFVAFIAALWLAARPRDDNKAVNAEIDRIAHERAESQV